MTLVLSVATPAFSLQVGDRLVSKGGVPHDPRSNKSVVCRATDGVLAFGYTGPAFVGGLPTDTWIADVLTDGACAAQTGALRYGEFPVRDVGTGLRNLSQRLSSERHFERFNGEVSAVGWQWSAKRSPALVRNVLWVLHNGSGQLRWEQIVPRHLPERKTVFRIFRVGDWPLSGEHWRRLVHQVGTAGADWQKVEELLIAAIQEASELRPGTIGRDCMSILLRPWLFPNVRVRFMPAAPDLWRAGGQAVEVAYSPWLVAPDAILEPMVQIGGLSCEQGLLTYAMESPPVPETQALKATFASQPRAGG